MDNFAITLSGYPAAKGYIIVYAARNGGTKDMERAIQSIKNIYKFMKRDMSRITIVRGGFREYNTVDSWLLFENAEPPTPTPTVDKKFVIPNIVKKSGARRKR